jgi:arylsulfatase A-like enzyme
LGEHKDFEHSFWLYDELLRVPLIVKIPEKEDAGSINHNPVQLNDIFAEILFHAGIDIPEFTQGQPLNQVKHPIIAEVKREPVLASQYPALFDRDLIAIYSQTNQGFKLIQSSDGREEVYNLESDSFELINIKDSQEANAIKDELKNYLSLLQDLAAVVKPVATKKKKLDKATIERLKSLGYLK